MPAARALGDPPRERRARARAAQLLQAALLLTLLAACSSTPPKRSGGFYQDDGPPPEVPRDLARTPDAVPRVEPFHPYANRPYTALGRRYTPLTEDRPFRQRGLASWYGRQFHGNRTASGERYDMLAMTAAHPTLPIPSYVRVTHLKNGASAIVRVNDRGPFKHDRVIDLSYAAATKLGFVASGVGEVEVVRLTHADIRAGRFGVGGDTTAERNAVADMPPALLPAAPRAALPSSNAVAVAGTVVGVPSVTPSSATAAPAAPASRWSVQLGAFESAANAEALRDRMSLLLAQSDGFAPTERSARVESDGGLHRVLVGALSDRSAAQALAERLERYLGRNTALYQR